MQSSIHQIDSRLNFTPNVVYTFVFNDKIEYYLYMKTSFFQKLEIKLNEFDVHRIVIIDRDIDIVISVFPRLTSIFMCFKSNHLYDEYSFTSLKYLVSFQWPDRPTLEKNVQQMILNRVFICGYANRLCSRTSSLQNVSGMFFGQRLFDKELIKEIFKFVEQKM